MIYKYIFKKLKEDCQKPEDGTVLLAEAAK
uniref:Uncharacterized protein n=1 Tax=Anguilla anguilla TaxID=7936 RepID=A0A0E9P520_ANGAN